MIKAKIYAVIVNWNRPDETLQCISSLYNQKGVSLHIIIVDNGSNDNSVERIKLTFPDAHLIYNSENLGFSKGYNIGIRYAMDNGADYIFIINNDAYIAEDTLITLFQYSYDESIGIVAPIILFSSNPDVIWSAGGNMNHFLLEKTDDWISKKYTEEFPDVIYRDFVTGCCFLAPRRTFEKIGLFDEQFILYYEDFDFCFRVRQDQLRIIVATKAKAWHHISTSSGGADSPNERYWMARSSILFFKKHVRGFRWFLVFFWRTGSAIRTTFRLLRNRQTISLKHYWQGLIDGVRSNY